MEQFSVCSNWEEFDEDPSILDKEIEKLRLEKTKTNATSSEPKIRILTRNKNDATKGADPICISSPSSDIVLDTTREEHLRSQYVPPEPRITLLTRPKSGSSNVSNGPTTAKARTSQPVKSLEQREKEYMEARKRILGDVNFEDSLNSTDEESAGLSPAEILKQKVFQAMKPADDDSETKSGASSSTPENSQGKSKSRGKRNREKLKTPNPESPKDFPVSKTDCEHIIRQPRGPDGTAGFNR